VRSAAPKQVVARGIWIAWTIAFLGGVLVVIATVLALTDPCAEGGQATVRAACEPSQTATLAARLAILGTSLAVIGGVGAAMVLFRRRSSPWRDASGTKKG